MFLLLSQYDKFLDLLLTELSFQQGRSDFLTNKSRRVKVRPYIISPLTVRLAKTSNEFSSEKSWNNTFCRNYMSKWGEGEAKKVSGRGDYADCGISNK